MFTTQSEARQFFIDKIVERARIDGVMLSHDEREMLCWSESAPDSIADPALPDRLAANITDAAYEAKIAELLRRSFYREVGAVPDSRDRWRDARSVLKGGDHYLLVMLDEAIGRQFRPWWQMW